MASGGGSSSWKRSKRRDHKVVNIQKNLRQKKMKKKKDLTKDPLAADAASEEMLPQNIMWSLKCPLTSLPILLQKIVNEQKENA